MGEAVLLSWYLACGPLVGTLVTARPPAGRAGDVGRYPLGKGREEPFGFPLSPSVNKPLLPPARAGGRAMRRRSWRPQARPLPDQPPSPIPPTREWGSKGKEPPSPWCSFPYFFKEIGPRLGSHRSPPFQRRSGKTQKTSRSRPREPLVFFAFWPLSLRQALHRPLPAVHGDLHPVVQGPGGSNGPHNDRLV